MSTVAVAAAAIDDTCLAALVGAGALPENAAPVARAIARAEAEGNRVCGLFYLPIFCAHLQSGKVDGRAVPALTGGGSAWTVDARHGFAHPAIEGGTASLVAAARSLGVAALSVRNSYNCLALGHHVIPLADKGLVGLCVSNAPASVAPPGATGKLFGTNPLAFAAPMPEGVILVDQSLSAVTKTEVLMRRDRGEAIPVGWAQDASGKPTTDPATGLSGSLLPAGGQKGANMALIVEVLAAALSGSRLSAEASPFGDNAGGPPGVGQFLLAIDPARFGAGTLGSRLGRLAECFGEAGVRLPGACRQTSSRDWREAEVGVDPEVWATATKLASPR